MRKNSARRGTSTGKPSVKHGYAVLLPLAAVFAAPVNAMDYSAVTQLRTQGQYTNNIQLTPQKESASGIDVIPSLSLRGNSETNQVSLDGTASFKRFDRSSFDSNDQTLKASFNHQFERSSVGLSAAMIRDSTLTSELLDSGRVTNASRHTQYQVSPSWSWFLGERDSLSLTGAYVENKYDSDAYTGYKLGRGSLQWTHILNERAKLFAALSHSNIRYDETETLFQTYTYKSRDTGLQVGGSYIFSEQLSGNVMFGRTNYKNTYDKKVPEQTCLINVSIWSLFVPSLRAYAPLCTLEGGESQLSTLDAGLTWASERNQLSLQVTQQSQPSSNGNALKSTQASAHWEFKVWERGTVFSDLIAGRNRALGGGSDSRIVQQSDRTFGYGSLGYRHALTEQWSVEGWYQYGYQRYDQHDFKSSANSQAVYLGLSYKPREWHWSR